METYLTGVGEKISGETRACKACGGAFRVLSGVRGRPREFCSIRCRRDFGYQREKAQLERQRAEERKRCLEEWERQRQAWYGTAK